MTWFMLSNLTRYYWYVTRHKFWIAFYLSNIICRLLYRAVVHDVSKYRWDETYGFIPYVHEFISTPYHSAKRKKLSEISKDVARLHYSRNTHHPEHHGGIKGMTALDEVEMVCDWCAAQRTKTKSKDLKIDTQRFSLGEERFSFYSKLARIIGFKAIK